MSAPVIGIDPGLSGAIAVISGNYYAVHDMPVIPAGKGAFVKRAVDLEAVARILRESTSVFGKDHVGRVVIERVNAFPGQGVSSMFSLGMSFYGVAGVAAGIGLRVDLVGSAEWKRHFELDSDKEKSLTMARFRFPLVELSRKKDHGRAEALLIALYGKETRK